MPSDSLAMVRIPSADLAPGYRSSLTDLSHFKVDDLGAGVVAVAPAEGAGAIAKHFELIKICDAGSDFDDPGTWAPVRDHPPRRRSDIDDPLAYRQAMIDRGQEIIKQNPSNESQIVAFALAALGAAQAGDLPDLLAANVPGLLREFPEGSLWLVAVDDVLLSRLAFGRTQLAMQMTPDIPLGAEMERLRAFEHLTLTRGVEFGEVIDFALLALSPAVLGLQIPATPHVLVFCFGGGLGEDPVGGLSVL